MEDAAWFGVFFGYISPHGGLSWRPLGWGLRGHPQLCPLPAAPPSPSLPPLNFSGLLRARRTQTSSGDLARAVSKIPNPRGSLGLPAGRSRLGPFPFCSSPGFYGKNPARFRSGLALLGRVPGALDAAPARRRGGGFKAQGRWRGKRLQGHAAERLQSHPGGQKSGRKRRNRARIWGDGAGITQQGFGDATWPRSAASPGHRHPRASLAGWGRRALDVTQG